RSAGCISRIDLRMLIITGGSRGIGAATAILAAARGHAVCLNYLRRQESALEVAGRIRNDGGRAVAIQAAVSSETAGARLLETAERELGRITGLGNNAATIERQARLESFDADRLQRMFKTNVIGPFLCAREAVRRMSTRHGGEGGAIVNVSSAAARIGS